MNQPRAACDELSEGNLGGLPSSENAGIKTVAKSTATLVLAILAQRHLQALREKSIRK
jgi:hypothetical protein